MAKKETWTEYRFADGWATTVKKLSPQELAWKKRKHGKLIEKREVKA